MTELETKLFLLLEEERAKSDALLEMLLKAQGLIEKEEVITVQTANSGLGRKPWYMQKSILERRYAKHEHEQDDVSSSNGEYDAKGENTEEGTPI